jgi:hypothetical protein
MSPPPQRVFRLLFSKKDGNKKKHQERKQKSKREGRKKEREMLRGFFVIYPF